MHRSSHILMLFTLPLQALDFSPRVSIITSIYNGDKFIAGFMEDIVRQTIFEECELILINANSPGKEGEIIKPYLEQYPNIVYIELHKDPGLYNVWNLGIEKARAEYITNANIDDRVAHHCYEVHAKTLDENPDVDLVYSGTIFTNTPNVTFNQALNNGVYIKFIRCMSDFSLQSLFRECSPHDHPMWRKSMNEKYGLFDGSFKTAGDFEMWLRAATRGAKFLRIPQILGVFYWNLKGLSHKPRASKEVKRIREMYRKYLD